MRDCFSLAKKKIEEKQAKGSIIFIDEVGQEGAVERSWTRLESSGAATGRAVTRSSEHYWNC